MKNTFLFHLQIILLRRNIFFHLTLKRLVLSFLKKGKKLGNYIENGRMMFIHQAAEAFKIWHGIEPKINKEVIGLVS